MCFFNNTITFDSEWDLKGFHSLDHFRILWNLFKRDVIRSGDLEPGGLVRLEFIANQQCAEFFDTIKFSQKLESMTISFPDSSDGFDDYTSGFDEKNFPDIHYDFGKKAKNFFEHNTSLRSLVIWHLPINTKAMLQGLSRGLEINPSLKTLIHQVSHYINGNRHTS